MADFEIIEADFQQYYNLDIASIKFQRYARLLINLPMESRFFQKYSPLKDWNWDKEVQSRILQMLEIIFCTIANMHRKKGAKPLRPNEQFQPDYVKKAKIAAKKEAKGLAKEDRETLAAIFEKKNDKVKKLGEINGKDILDGTTRADAV